MNSTLALSPSSRFPNENLAERILDAFPSGSYALSALLRLMDIVESTDVPTAAVECRVQPRLLVNPAFVTQHAQTSDKLLMLVMHELHHVLLGHTTLFARVTPVQNFVFDAVINGIVCRMFDREEHTAFFTDYYDADSFPQCLLRPPPGWPLKPVMAGGIAALPEAQRSSVNEIHVALYSATGATYQEVFDSLPRILKIKKIGDIPLLGGHRQDGIPDGQLDQFAPLMFDVVRGIVEQWPQPPDPIRGRSLADVLKEMRVSARRIPSNRATLRKLIRKVAGFHNTGTMRQAQDAPVTVSTPLPSVDRRSIVLHALGYDSLLHAGQTRMRRIVQSGERVHVYLDVSGSMEQVKGALYAAVLDCEKFVHPVVHLFSSKVADISLAELRRGVCKSTGGTDIACVAEHMATNRVKRALMITDGWVGAPRGRHHSTLAQVKLAVAFLGTNPNATDLKSVLSHSATLSIGT